MSMRVTQDGLLQTVVEGLRGGTDRMNKLYNELATERRVNVASDDPAGAGVILRLGAQLSAMQQAQANGQSASTLMDTASASLGQIADNMATVESLAVTGNGAAGATDRATLADQVNGYLEDMVQSANSKFDNRYLFSGAATNKPAVAVTRNAAGDIQSVSYNGSSTALEVPLQGERTIVAGVTAKDALVDSGLFAGLISLRDTLRNTNGLSEADQTAALASAQDQIKNGRQTLLDQTGMLGARESQLQDTNTQLADGITRVQDALSNARDADVAQVTVQLQQETTLYQALLGASNKILSHSLLDYIQ